MDFGGDFGGGDWFFDGVGSNAEGGSFFGDFFGNFFGDFFGAGSEGIMGDVLGGVGRGMAEEGAFARIFNLFGEGMDVYWDYLLWQDMTGRRGASFHDFKSAWNGMGEAEKEGFQNIKDAVKGHVLFREQLEKYETEKGVKELSENFKALGYEMPGEDLLSKSYRKLTIFFHPDKTQGDKVLEEVFKELGAAKEAMQDGSKSRLAYEQLLREDPDKFKTIYEQFSKEKIEDIYRESERASRKLLNAGPMGKAQSWVAALSGGEKAALAVGVIGLTAAATYGIAKLVDERNKNPQKQQAKYIKETYQSFAQQIQQDSAETIKHHIKR